MPAAYGTLREMLAKCALAIAVLALGALGLTSADAAPASGLRGLVTRSPIAPVCMQGKPCSGPAKNTPLTFSRRGKVVKSRTDGTGRYRVSLAPGSWNVTTTAAPRIGTGIKPRVVSVVAARFRVVNFAIDTGIR
jgi:hypothetical protein